MVTCSLWAAVVVFIVSIELPLCGKTSSIITKQHHVAIRDLGDGKVSENPNIVGQEGPRGIVTDHEEEMKKAEKDESHKSEPNTGKDKGNKDTNGSKVKKEGDKKKDMDKGKKTGSEKDEKKKDTEKVTDIETKQDQGNAKVKEKKHDKEEKNKKKKEKKDPEKVTDTETQTDQEMAKVKENKHEKEEKNKKKKEKKDPEKEKDDETQKDQEKAKVKDKKHDEDEKSKKKKKEKDPEKVKDSEKQKKQKKAEIEKKKQAKKEKKAAKKAEKNAMKIKLWPLEKVKHWAGPIQSPVDLITDRAKDMTNDLPLMEIINHDLEGVKATIHNTGSTVYVRINEKPDKRPSLIGGPLRYKFAFEKMQFHWGSENIWGSEHFIDGEGFSVEIQMVYYNHYKYKKFTKASKERDGLVVLTVFAEATHDEDNELFNPLYKLLPKITNAGSKAKLECKLAMQWVRSAMTTNKEYFAYPGSLTSRPFTENVLYILLPTPILLSKPQLKAFRALHKAHHENTKGQGTKEKHFDGVILDNKRDLQPLNRRPTIKSSRLG